MQGGICNNFIPGPILLYFPTCTGKKSSSQKLPNTEQRSFRNLFPPSGWSTRNTHWHWMTCLHWQIRTGSTTRLLSNATKVSVFHADFLIWKIYVMKKAYMFMLKVIGIYFFVSAKGHEHVWRVDYGICPP